MEKEKVEWGKRVSGVSRGQTERSQGGDVGSKT
jgi:hypothetical protein